MKVDGHPADNFEYRGWLVSIEVTGGETMFSGHADLHLDGDHKGRVVLAAGRADQAAARWALDSKARDFVDEWVTRSQAGATDVGAFGET